MTAVYCAGCGEALTRPLRRAVTAASVMTRRSSFFIDPDALVTIEGVERVERELDPAGAIVVHPDDRISHSLATVDGQSYGCCGLDGLDGPNQACSNCGRIIGTARTDCWMDAHEMRFWPTEVNLR
jgi:hypothetical protein